MGATVPQMGAAAPIVMQMGATDLRSHPDGGCVQNSLQMGATVPQMGATFSIVLQMGATDLCSHPVTQMGAEFKILFRMRAPYGSLGGGVFLNCNAALDELLLLEKSIAAF